MILEKEHKHLKAKETKHKKKLDKHMEDIAKQAFVTVMAPSHSGSAFDGMLGGSLAEKKIEKKSG